MAVISEAINVLVFIINVILEICKGVRLSYKRTCLLMSGNKSGFLLSFESYLFGLIVYRNYEFFVSCLYMHRVLVLFTHKS